MADQSAYRYTTVLFIQTGFNRALAAGCKTALFCRHENGLSIWLDPQGQAKRGGASSPSTDPFSCRVQQTEEGQSRHHKQHHKQHLKRQARWDKSRGSKPWIYSWPADSSDRVIICILKQVLYHLFCSSVPSKRNKLTVMAGKMTNMFPPFIERVHSALSLQICSWAWETMLCLIIYKLCKPCIVGAHIWPCLWSISQTWGCSPSQ